MYSLTKPYGFKAGTVFSYRQLQDAKFLRFVAAHFNSVTASNEMKAYSLLNREMSRKAADGMPCMDYATADAMVQWARENGLQVRGHVLVWDAYMLDWFFREDYDEARPFACRDVIRKRMESYIRQVVTHFEEKFPGTVYCWDVVNEAVGDNAGEYLPDDPHHLRTLRDGQANLFQACAGEDYVEYAFLCARNVVEELGADIKLFYNDYNTFFPEKRKAIMALLQSINAYAKDQDGACRRLADGVGMQGYIGGFGKQEGCMDEADLEKIQSAIAAYAALGLEVHITEMAVRNYEKERAEEHAVFYEKLMRVLMSFGKDGASPLTCVAIWGLSDTPHAPHNSYGYFMNGPYCGLIDEHADPKPVFYRICQTLKGQ